MKVIVAGGSGFIGRALCAALAAGGHSVAVLTRSPSRKSECLPGDVEAVGWNPLRVGGDWAAAVAESDAVVNLAGATIAGARWTTARKALLRSSRLDSTNALVEAIRRAPATHRPAVLVSASAIGFYGDRGDEVLDETSQSGHDFLSRLCVEWETAAREAEDLGVRVVLVRTGIVLGRGGGALPTLALPFRLFGGGPLGSGRQWMSWVHLEDEIGLFRHAIERDAVRGPLNATAPAPARNREVAAAVGRALGRASWLPAPTFAMRLVLGEMAGAVLGSQRVLPRVAEATGYQFRYADLDSAVRAAL